MSRGKRVSSILKNLKIQPLQSYLGVGLHTLGLLNWILQQTGPADVYISTFSTSEEFLSGFFNLKRKHLINHSVMLADLKASKKTVHLYQLMQNCFDSVFLGQNHSKIILVQNENWLVSVLSSQNQTYGDRNESTIVCTNPDIFLNLFSGFKNIIDDNSIQINGLFNRLDTKNRRAGASIDATDRDIIPSGH